MVVDLRNHAHSWYYPHGGLHTPGGAVAVTTLRSYNTTTLLCRRERHWRPSLLQHTILAAPVPCHEYTQGDPARRGGRWDASTCCDGSGVHRRQIVLRDHAVLKPFQQRTPPGPRGSPEILAQCDDDMRVVEPHATYIAALLGLVNGCTRYGRQLTTETRRRTWAPSWTLHG